MAEDTEESRVSAKLTEKVKARRQSRAKMLMQYGKLEALTRKGLSLTADDIEVSETSRGVAASRLLFSGLIQGLPLPGGGKLDLNDNDKVDGYSDIDNTDRYFDLDADDPFHDQVDYGRDI